MKVFVDTSVFARIVDSNERLAAQREAAERLVGSDRELVTSPLVLAQLFSAITSGKKGQARVEAEIQARRAVAGAAPFSTDRLENRHVAYALELLARRQMGLWDAILWSSAILSGCTHWASFDRPGLPHEVDGVKWLDPLTFDA